jgi:hypothetical protein
MVQMTSFHNAFRHLASGTLKPGVDDRGLLDGGAPGGLRDLYKSFSLPPRQPVKGGVSQNAPGAPQSHPGAILGRAIRPVGHAGFVSFRSRLASSFGATWMLPRASVLQVENGGSVLKTRL